MPNILPAAGETYVLDAKGRATHVIVGWIHIQGSRVDPIFVSTRGGIRRNEAIGIYMRERERVEHPHSGKVFASNAQWVEYAEEHEAEWATIEIKQPEAVASEDGAVADGPLKFGTTTNKGSAFFIWPNALGVAKDGVFEIPGETPHPNDARVKKIKRTEMAAAKREGAQKIDPKKWPLVQEVDGEAISPADYADLAREGSSVEPDEDGEIEKPVTINYDDL